MTACASYIKSKKFKQSKSNRGLAILSLSIVISLIGLSFFYIFQTNGLVSSSYQIRKHEQRISQLELESQRLEIKIAQWQSPANLEELVNSLSLIEMGKVIYLGRDKAVAER